MVKEWTGRVFIETAGELGNILMSSDDRETVRRRVLDYVNKLHFDTFSGNVRDLHVLDLIIVRDCARAWRSILNPRSEKISGFSVLDALMRASRGMDDRALTPSFWADIIHLTWGIQGRVRLHTEQMVKYIDAGDFHGREAAKLRSHELDSIEMYMDKLMSRYESGLSEEAVVRRTMRRKAILKTLKGTSRDWKNWKWHIRHIAKNSDALSRMVNLTDEEKSLIDTAVSSSIPFGVTPYYASLFDDDPSAGRDRSIRAQVIPPKTYIDAFHEKTSDYMLEADTSPIDLITRRYVEVLILKPFNTCPQICVYCQRNWEIKSAMAPGAMASAENLNRAIEWIRNNASIKEVLVTGGDPLVMTDPVLKKILDRLADIPHVERIRIGTRTPVTLPMRFTPELIRLISSYNVPKRREMCVMTHIQHPYEVTPELSAATNALRRHGIRVYNQLVYTFYISRRFAAAALRRLIRLCGVDPYYTFYPKGKEETADYRVPVARLVQEQKEESRLLPGLCRTDEAVFNLPGLGKNYLNAWQHRDLISIRSDGSRIYEFHPWEKKIGPQQTYIGEDVPILDYLRRLESIGENPADYESIWYYF